MVNNSETLTVWLGLKLSQLMEVNLKNQVMTTNLWVPQKWYDYKLRWDPEEYGGVEMLYIPSEHIWLPDIVLFNNWDGNYEVCEHFYITKKTNFNDCFSGHSDDQSNFEVYGRGMYTGVIAQQSHSANLYLLYFFQVFWEPPAIYKSSCEINVEYFPYDEQTCFMKFGSWTYNGAQVDLRHLDQVRNTVN